MLEIEVDGDKTVVVNLNNNSFVHKWAQLFEETLSTCDIEQNNSFSCVLSETQSQQRLLSAIQIVNKFLKKQFIEVPDTIDWDNQDWYNYLHSKFEKLSGPFGEPTKLFMLAPGEVKTAIRDINTYVHRLETRPYKPVKAWYISFDKNRYRRIPLQPDDYNLFQYHLCSGEAFIQYAELGKTYLDIFNDNLPLDYQGVKNLHYYSAEFSIWLSDQDKIIYEDDFYQWANNNGIDTSNKQLGLGFIPIGKVTDVSHARNIVCNGSKITNLRINHGKTI